MILTVREAEQNVIKEAVKWEEAERHWHTSGTLHLSDSTALCRAEKGLILAVANLRQARRAEKEAREMEKVSA
jgi:hypothetical protein